MIRFDHVTKKYPGTKRPALEDITLEVLRGEFVFLVGASGSGKSSCLRLILKEEGASRGSIHVLGQDVSAISTRKVPYFRRNLGVVFQDFRLLPNKNVYENVAFTLRVIGKSKGFIQEAVPDVLDMVGLDGKANRLPHELSGGEQQRVAIARAVVNKPQILLADEPTGNLDPTTSAGIMAVLDRINASGTTVVMATHEAGFVDQMRKRVIELVAGQMVRDERHGGYGTTSAVRTVAAPGTLRSEHRAAEEERERERVLVGATASILGVSPEQYVATQEMPSLPRTDPTPTASVIAQRTTGIVQPLRSDDPRDAGAGRPSAPGGGVRESREASAGVPTGDVPTTTGHIRRPALPSEGALHEQLGLAEKLGLRTASTDGDDQQDVGPTR